LVDAGRPLHFPRLLLQGTTFAPGIVMYTSLVTKACRRMNG